MDGFWSNFRGRIVGERPCQCYLRTGHYGDQSRCQVVDRTAPSRTVKVDMVAPDKEGGWTNSAWEGELSVKTRGIRRSLTFSVRSVYGSIRPSGSFVSSSVCSFVVHATVFLSCLPSWWINVIWEKDNSDFKPDAGQQLRLDTWSVRCALCQHSGLRCIDVESVLLISKKLVHITALPVSLFEFCTQTNKERADERISVSLHCGAKIHSATTRRRR